MKKKILGVALFLLIGYTYASAASLASTSATNLAPQIGQSRIERNIVSTELPSALQADIKTDYKDYWITECSEKGKKSKEDYFITLENADQTVQLKSTDRSTWDVVSTIVK